MIKDLLNTFRACAHRLHGMSDGRASQRRLLGMLLENDGMTQRAMQDEAGVRSGTLSEVLGKLESAGLIERRADSEDKRGLKVFLTAPGREAAEKQTTEYGERSGHMFDCLSDAEQESMLDMLKRLDAHWASEFPEFSAKEEHYGHGNHNWHNYDRENHEEYGRDHEGRFKHGHDGKGRAEHGHGGEGRAEHGHGGEGRAEHGHGGEGRAEHGHGGKGEDYAGNERANHEYLNQNEYGGEGRGHHDR